MAERFAALRAGVTRLAGERPAKRGRRKIDIEKLWAAAGVAGGPAFDPNPPGWMPLGESPLFAAAVARSAGAAAPVPAATVLPSIQTTGAAGLTV